MNWFEFLLFVHVMAAIVWLGAGIALTVVGTRFQNAKDPVAAAAFGQHTGDLGQKMFMPASITVLVSGILMVVDVGIDWEEPFIVVGILAVIVSSIIGATILGPAAEKLAAVVQEKGPDAPEIESMTKRFLLMSRLDIGLLIVAVFFMTVKPFS